MPSEPLRAALSTRVLLVEDSPDWQDILTRVVRSLPQLELVAVVDTVAAAIEALGLHAPHAVVLDLHLRDGSGHEVLAAAKRANPACKVIVVTVSDSLEDARRCRALGVDHYISKHKDADKLRVLLNNIGAGGAN